MVNSSVFALVIGILIRLQFIFSDESCQLSEKPRLQIAFVLAYSQNRTNAWIRFQNATAQHLIEFIQAEFPQTEFSVVGFLDYPDNSNPRRNARFITDPELCYFVTQEFTDQKEKILKAFSVDKTVNAQINNYRNDQEDSLTTGMLFAAVEKKLRWNPGFYDSNGKIVRKVMILMTWRKITKFLENPGTRTVPKADGTDTCSTAIPPTFDQLNRVLFEQNFAIINAIHNIKKSIVPWLAEEEYEKEFANIYAPYYPVPYPAPGQRSDSDGNDGNRDYKPYAELLFKTLKKEVLECDWEDPIGYNSLGL